MNRGVLLKIWKPKRLWVLGTFVFSVFLSFGSPPPFIINSEYQSTRLNPYLQVIQNSEDIAPEEVWRMMLDETRSRAVESTSFGFSNDLFWIKFAVESKDTTASNNVILINNPHLNLVKVWEDQGEKGLKQVYYGGDGMPFYERTIINRNIVFPVIIQPNETKSYLVQVDKRNASVSVPIHILSQTQFEKEERENLFAFGMYFGILLLIVVFSLFVFYILRQNIFFWYAFYLTFLGMYLLAHIGFLFQIGYPNQNWFGDYSRPVFITLSTMALIHFIRLLLNIESLLPKWNKLYTFMITFLGVVTLYWVATPWWHSVQTIVYLNVQNLSLLLSMILVLTTSVLTFKKQKIVVMFFWIAFVAVLFAGLSIILVESGLVSESVMAINPLFFGSIIEAVVFAVGLSYWSKVNDGERLNLVDMIHHSKKQVVNSYIQGVEEEKNKIASDLHDDIGSRLSHLKRQLEKNSNTDNTVILKLENLVKRVRKISHELSPPSFQTDEFVISLKHLVFSHQMEGQKINLQLFDLPSFQDKNLTKQLYRIIQSSLNSIEKHANATQVDVQFFYHESELVLAIEDDGQGFKYNKDAPGITMKAMLSRVELIKGTIEVSSSKRHGTSIMINVPISNNQLIEKSQ